MQSKTKEQNVGQVERRGSLALGTGLAALALKNRGALSVPTGVAALALLFRGSTGFCPLYEALGLNTDEGQDHAAWEGRDATAKRRQEEDWQDDHDLVTEASQESFPASDPPSYNPGTAT